MTPRRIIATALKRGVDIIAVSDHNSAENAEVAVRIAEDRGITVLPAMEITSYEEAHVVALFDTIEKIAAFQEVVYKNLPDGINDERLRGYQLVVNEKDEILSFNKRLLFNATLFSLKDLVDAIHSHGGLAVASHIDREFFSVISQFGFIPEGIQFDALEISYNTKRAKADAMFGAYRSSSWITSSDAHHLDDIGRRTTAFFLEEASFEEIARAFKGERRIEWSDGVTE